MGGPHLWLYLVDARARDLSHRSPGLAPDPTPHRSWPFAVLPEEGTSLSEVSPSPAQGTWPTYWPEGGSRKISPFGNHEDPDLRTPSLAALRSGRLGLGSDLAGGPTSSSHGTDHRAPATETQDSGCLQPPLCLACDLGQKSLRILKWQQQSVHRAWGLGAAELQPPHHTQSGQCSGPGLATTHGLLAVWTSQAFQQSLWHGAPPPTPHHEDLPVVLASPHLPPARSPGWCHVCPAAFPGRQEASARCKVRGSGQGGRSRVSTGPKDASCTPTSCSAWGGSQAAKARSPH